MYASHFAGEYEDPSVLLQRPVTVAVDGASKEHPVVGLVFDAFQVAAIVAIVTDDHQRPITAHLPPSRQHEVRIVLRLQTAHVEHVASRLQVEAVESQGTGRNVGTVRDNGRL